MPSSYWVSVRGVVGGGCCGKERSLGRRSSILTRFGFFSVGRGRVLLVLDMVGVWWSRCMGKVKLVRLSHN